MSKKPVIIDLTHLADFATVIIHWFLKTDLKAEDEIVKAWTDKDSMQWLVKLYNDELNFRMRWAINTDDSAKYVRDWVVNVIPQHLLNENKCDIDKVVERLCRERLSRIVFEVDDRMNTLFQDTDDSWMIWSTRFYHGVLIFEPETDYRIRIFNEKVESGEWRVNE